MRHKKQTRDLIIDEKYSTAISYIGKKGWAYFRELTNIDHRITRYQLQVLLEADLIEERRTTIEEKEFIRRTRPNIPRLSLQTLQTYQLTEKGQALLESENTRQVIEKTSKDVEETIKKQQDLYVESLKKELKEERALLKQCERRGIEVSSSNLEQLETHLQNFIKKRTEAIKWN